MPDFILDTCSDVVEGQKSYISQFFKDVKSLQDYKIVTGGSKMMEEISGKESLLRVVTLFKSLRKVKEFPSNTVDASTKKIRAATQERFGEIPSECDDFHILGLAKVSSCKNIITRDTRMGKCVGKIRPALGHDTCPTVRLIKDEDTYKKLKAKGQL